MTQSQAAINKGALLAVILVANFMVTLDIAIVNVALPSLQAELGVDPGDLQWVVTMYALMLGGFLLLGGRAADLLGRRNILITGVGLFTSASLVAGLSNTLGLLIGARAVQGIGAALVVPSALSIIANTFAQGPERTKAIGAFGAVGGSAATVGVVAGGALSSGPGWEWIFFLNLPIGIALIVLALRFVPPSSGQRGVADIPGAILVTAGLLTLVYGISEAPEHTWASARTVGTIAAGLALLVAFVVVEARSPAPLLPLGMFRRRILSAANLVAALVFASFFATIFQASLFMQQVLGYSAFRTGAAYIPIAGTTVVIAAAIAPILVERIGSGATLAIGQAINAVGLIWLAQAPADASYWSEVFPGFLLIGIGTGSAAMASEVAAFIGIEERLSGLAGGMIETSREIGGALGVAIVATVALARTDTVLSELGGDPANFPLAFTEGFERGNLVAAGFAIAGAIAAAAVLRPAEADATRTQERAAVQPAHSEALRSDEP